MRVAVIGSRTLTDYAIVSSTLKNSNQPITCIISGGANGADKLAERYASDNNIPILIHHPQWELYGRSAGPIRNQLIVNDSDVIVAFWDGVSKGTKSTINIANKMGKPVFIVKI